MAFSEVVAVLLAAFVGQAVLANVISPHQLIEQAHNLNCRADDDLCLREEFALRRRADQSVRNPSVLEAACEGYTGSEAGEQACRQRLWHEVDTANLARLEQIFSIRGWPALGGDAEVGAWLIAQHAPRDAQSFRERVLTTLKAAVQAHRLDPQYLAMMSDRNAVYRGEPQLYGTQRYCLDGRLDMSKTGDVDEADRLRTEIGMDFSLTEELPYLNEQCAKDAEQERQAREK